MPRTQSRYTLQGGLRNLGFYSGLTLLTLLTIVFSPPLHFYLCKARGLDSARAVRRIIWLYGRAWTVMTGLFVPFSTDTGTAGDYPGPCVVVANHQSFFDAFCLGALPFYDLIFAVRAWPFRIPFYGPYMRRAGYLNSEHATIDDFLREGKRCLAQGVSVIVFPEGTRSPDGRLGRFYSGAFKLAMEADVPVVPLCIDGTGRFLPRGRAWVHGASISVKKMAPVYPRSFLEHGAMAHIAMRKNVKEALAAELSRRHQASGTEEK